VPDYFPHVSDRNESLVTTGRTRKSKVEPALSTGLLTDLNCMDSGARVSPLYLRPSEVEVSPDPNFDTLVPNLSAAAIKYTESLNVTERELFYHCLSTTHSLAYRWENTGSLRLEWPRVPLTTDRETLLASAELGAQVAALLDTERSVPEVTSGRLRSEIKIIAVPSRAGGGVLNPDTGDLNVNASWGRSQNGAIMPGQGIVIPRDYTPRELAAIEEEARAMSLPRLQTLARLGETTYDIYLNNVAYWKNVPSRV